MPLERRIIHSLAAHYNLKRLLSVLPVAVIPYELASGACHLSALPRKKAFFSFFSRLEAVNTRPDRYFIVSRRLRALYIGCPSKFLPTFFLLVLTEFTLERGFLLQFLLLVFVKNCENDKR